MRMDRFKEAEAEAEKVLAEAGLKCYGLTVTAFIAKWNISTSGITNSTANRALHSCVEQLRRTFAPGESGLEITMIGGDELYSPCLVVRETETGVWP